MSERLTVFNPPSRSRNRKRRKPMARRRKKSRRSRSKRRNPHRARRRSHRRRHSNPMRSHRRRHGRRRHRRNPLSGFSPMSSLKTVAADAAPIAVGYFGVNIVQMLLKRLFLDKALASQSAGVQQAADIGARLFIGVPAVTMLGGSLLKGKGGLIAAGAATNVVVNVGRAVAANVPGIPGWASETLGDYPGTPGAYQAAGVYGFLKPGAPSGTGNFLAPHPAGGKPMAAAQGGRAFL